MRNDTIIWLFENNCEYYTRQRVANTYRQKGLVLFNYMTKELKIRPKIIKDAVVETWKGRIYDVNRDEFVNEIVMEFQEEEDDEDGVRPCRITYYEYIEFIKASDFIVFLKAFCKGKNSKEYIDNYINDNWNENQDLFNNQDDEEEEEEQAPEPIYDVSPTATDVEICASFTNLLS